MQAASCKQWKRDICIQNTTSRNNQSSTVRVENTSPHILIQRAAGGFQHRTPDMHWNQHFCMRYLQKSASKMATFFRMLPKKCSQISFSQWMLLHLFSPTILESLMKPGRVVREWPWWWWWDLPMPEDWLGGLNRALGKCPYRIDGGWSIYLTRWCFQILFMLTPIWGRFPFSLIFFRWVETTNQLSVMLVSCWLFSLAAMGYNNQTISYLVIV